jgi:hypothetical protein
MQVCPEAQTTPQPPQLAGSDLVSGQGSQKPSWTQYGSNPGTAQDELQCHPDPQSSLVLQVKSPWFGFTL